MIALVVTPDGFPLAYEVMNGDAADNSTLSDFLVKIGDGVRQKRGASG